MSRVLLAVWACFAGTVLAGELPVAPAIHGDVWINSAPLDAEQLRGFDTLFLSTMIS